MVSCLKNVAVSKSLEELSREVSRVQSQLVGKEEDSEISDENGPLPVPKSCADNFGLLARGENCTDVHLARLIGCVQKAGLDVHDLSRAKGSDDVLPANAYCSGTSNPISRVRSVARTVSSRRRIRWRAMELVHGHEFFLALSNRGALSILDASFKFARASFCVSGEL